MVSASLQAFIHGAKVPNLIGAYFKDVFTKAHRPELYNPSFNYDGLFSGIAAKCFSKYAFNLDPQDKYDLIMDVLGQMLTVQTVKAFDPAKGSDPIGYFGRMFQMRMITALQTELGHRRKQVWKPGGDERTDDEFMDSKTRPSNDLQENVEYTSLISALTKFLAGKPESKYYLAILKYSAEGYSNKELATKIGVAPSVITRYMDRFRDALVEFATKTGDHTFLTLIKEYSKSKKHALPDNQVDPMTQLFTDLKHHKVKLGTARTADLHRPTGDVTRISVKRLPDALDDNYLAKLILSPKISQKNIDASAEEFLKLLNASDDVIQDGKDLFAMMIHPGNPRV